MRAAPRRGRGMFASRQTIEPHSAAGPLDGARGTAPAAAGLLNRDDLAIGAATGDAGGAPSRAPQQKGHPMSQSSNGNGAHGPEGAANAPGDSPFNKPAPDGS